MENDVASSDNVRPLRYFLPVNVEPDVDRDIREKGLDMVSRICTYNRNLYYIVGKLFSSYTP